MSKLIDSLSLLRPVSFIFNKRIRVKNNEKLLKSKQFVFLILWIGS